MHDSSASRFRQRAGRTRGSATILRLLPQPPPHRSRVFRDPPSRGSHTVTCRTATGTCCRVNTARRSRPGAPEAASASGASSPPRAPPPRAAGRSAPRRHLRSGGAPAGLRRTLAPRQRRPEGAAAPRPPAPPVTPWTLHRQALRRSGSGALPSPICCEANHCIALSCRRQPKGGAEKKSFQLMISLGTGEGGGGGGQ